MASGTEKLVQSLKNKFRRSSSNSSCEEAPCKRLPSTSEFVSEISEREIPLTELLEELINEIKSLKTGQDSMKSMLSNDIADMKAELSLIRNDITRVQDSVGSQIQSLDERINIVESKLCENPERGGVNNHDLTIIASGVQQSRDEIPLNTAKLIVSALGPEVTRTTSIVEAKRISSRIQSKPGLLKIAFESLEQKKTVLRAKTNLKQSREFSKVFLRSSKTHTERIMEQNTKTMLNHMPGGKDYRITANGRLVQKQLNTDQTMIQRTLQTPDLTQPPPPPPQTSPMHQAVEQSYPTPRPAHVYVTQALPSQQPTAIQSYAMPRPAQPRLVQPAQRLSPMLQGDPNSMTTLPRSVSPIHMNPPSNLMNVMPPNLQHIDQQQIMSNVVNTLPDMQATPSGSMAMHNQLPMQTMTH